MSFFRCVMRWLQKSWRWCALAVGRARSGSWVLTSLALVAALFPSEGLAGDDAQAGPIYHEYDLVTAPGHRKEAFGPFFYTEQKDTQFTWAIPPLMSYTHDPAVDSHEFDFLYPIMAYDRFGDQYRWQFCQWWSFSGGPTQTETNKDRFTLFPIYWQQRSTDPEQEYTAVFPIYGTLRQHLFRNEIYFILWPLYCQTRKKDIVTDNYLVPFVHKRHGDGLTGWQVWPFIGNEHKDVTTQTNGFGDIKTIPGHDSFFCLWPFYFHDRTGIGTTNAAETYASLPFYSQLRSPQRDATTVLWPFFNYVDDRDKKYHEWDAPWPLVVFARGEGKNTTRVWPFFSQARSATLETAFYLWPVYKWNRVNSPPLDRHRTRILFFLYSDQRDRNTETEAYRRRVDFFPFYTYRHDLTGTTRFQVLSIFEPFMATSKSIERDYSFVWALWRSDHNPRTGAQSHSLLWNLYRHETRPESKKSSLLFGLFQYQSGSKGKALRLFYIPVMGSKQTAKSAAPVAPPKKG